MEKSRTLREYMIFVETVRNYEKEYEFKEAVEYAIDDCIRNNILRSFLIKSRAEVLRVFLFEYDQEKHIRQEIVVTESRLLPSLMKIPSSFNRS